MDEVLLLTRNKFIAFLVGTARLHMLEKPFPTPHHWCSISILPRYHVVEFQNEIFVLVRKGIHPNDRGKFGNRSFSKASAPRSFAIAARGAENCGKFVAFAVCCRNLLPPTSAAKILDTDI